MTVLEILEYAVKTLNDINVKGADDMKKMLGVIEALTQIKDIAKHPPEVAESKEEGSEVKDG